jgi:hypothetical protein
VKLLNERFHIKHLKGGFSMKKLIAVALAVVLLSVVFAGCSKLGPSCGDKKMGFTTLAATSGLTGSADTILASVYTVDTAEKVISFTFYANTTGNALAGIYTDNGGAPDVLVGQTAWTAVSATGITTISLAAPVNISAGSYWLVFLANAGIATADSAVGSSVYITGPVNPTGPLLTPFSANGTSGSTPFCLQLYANLTCQ